MNTIALFMFLATWSKGDAGPPDAMVNDAYQRLGNFETRSCEQALPDGALSTDMVIRVTKGAGKPKVFVFPCYGNG